VAGVVPGQPGVLGRIHHRGEGDLLPGVDPRRDPRPGPDQVDPGLPVQHGRVQLGQRPGVHRPRLRCQRRIHPPPTRLRGRHQRRAALLPERVLVEVVGRERVGRHRRVEQRGTTPKIRAARLVLHDHHARGEHRQFFKLANGFPPLAGNEKVTDFRPEGEPARARSRGGSPCGRSGGGGHRWVGGQLVLARVDEENGDQER
jgi:hypothetical protein